MTDQARQDQAHEESESEQHGYAEGGILGALNRVDEAKHASKHQHKAHDATENRGYPGLYANPSAQNGGDHAEGQQPVGVAQNAITLGT